MNNATAPASPRCPVAAHRAMHPLSMDDISIDPDSYWGQWQQVNADTMLDHCASWMERSGWVANLQAAAAGTLPQTRRGREFTDSDVYKLIEAMSWEQGRAPTPQREQAIQCLIHIVANAQEDDGYLNTNFGRPGQAPRYSDLEWGSELYDYGHLLQAAVARLRSHGPDPLLETATRAANHICETFREHGIKSVGGHPEIEMALLEFARATGEEKYRQQAEIFLQRRGHHTLADIAFGREYFQDDIPIRQAHVFRGHAVRATYLAAAAVDLGIDRGDEALIETIERQLQHTLHTRTYITGGMGSRFEDEAFGVDYELPADRAYSETCAAVGAFMLAWRLTLATGKACYGDLMERTLFNVIATSPAQDGQAFFYANTLHQRVPGQPVPQDKPSLRVGPGVRAPWFDVSCCPTNVARTLASLDSYLAAATSDGLSLILYSTANVRTTLADGRTASVRITTDYPNHGRVRLQITKNDGKAWNLRLRIPAWSQHSTIIRGDADPIEVNPGWADIHDVGATSEQIILNLDTAPRFTYGNPLIDSARGAVAVERGPLVYCLESPDLPTGVHVDQIIADDAIPPTLDNEHVKLTANIASPPAPDQPTYQPTETPEASHNPIEIPLLPYNHWARRGPSTMRVWIRTQ